MNQSVNNFHAMKNVNCKVDYDDAVYSSVSSISNHDSCEDGMSSFHEVRTRKLDNSRPPRLRSSSPITNFCQKPDVEFSNDG